MGTFRVSIAIGDPQGQQFEPVETLVDTGATYTTLPGSLLRRLGVPPDRRAEFELADGSTVELGMGQTWLRIDGATAIVPVVFAEEGSEPLLGAVTLEIFLLNVDPVRQRLVPTRGLLMTLTGQPAAPSTALCTSSESICRTWTTEGNKLFQGRVTSGTMAIKSVMQKYPGLRSSTT